VVAENHPPGHAHLYLPPNGQPDKVDGWQLDVCPIHNSPQTALGNAQETLRERARNALPVYYWVVRDSIKAEANLPQDGTANDMGMDSYETTTHPFIIKIWLEETAEEAGQAVWRGHVTHVPSGERRYIKNLDEIRAFIAPYLEDMGVKFRECWCVRQCLGRLKTCLGRKPGTSGRGSN
jgi:hypothetical protein